MNAVGAGRDDVIVVDENLSDYGALLTDFRLEGVRVSRYATVDDALKMARPRDASIWLVGTRLPDMSSWDFLKLLRRRTRRTVVLLVGDVYSPADEFAARLAGATAYVCKPPTPEWLCDCVRRCRSQAIRAGPASLANTAIA